MNSGTVRYHICQSFYVTLQYTPILLRLFSIKRNAFLWLPVCSMYDVMSKNSTRLIFKVAHQEAAPTWPAYVLA